MGHTRFGPIRLLLILALVLVPLTPFAVTQTPTLEGYPAAGAPASVTLLAPGSAPRRPLRYALAAGLTERMAMTTTVSMSMDLGGMSMPMSLPTMTVLVDLAITDVAANGDVTYSLAFADVTIEATPDANPMILQALEGMRPMLTATKGTSTMTNRGVATSTKLDMADPSAEQLLGQMMGDLKNMSLPLPEEAVGVGGRWEVRQAVTAAGQTTFSKASYEVVSIDDASVSLKVTVEQTAPPQSVTNPALPGATAMLEKLSGSGNGTTTLRFTSLVPATEMSSQVSTAMSVDTGAGVQNVSSDVKVATKIAAVKTP